SDQPGGERFGLAPATLSELEQEIKTSSQADAAETRRRTGLDLTSFSQTRIEGKVALEHKSLLVIQTPYDPGWKAFQNGQTAAVVKVDGGLLGVALDGGQHTVELRYRTPFLGLGIAITACSIVILLVGVWRWPRLRIIQVA
ncbi:MAG TPA: YfhO family protein, partial [Chthoniobacterales bacterium]|nr:YfhO family protein [Chthoniobacterales bacterium]